MKNSLVRSWVNLSIHISSEFVKSFATILAQRKTYQIFLVHVIGILFLKKMLPPPNVRLNRILKKKHYFVCNELWYSNKCILKLVESVIYIKLSWQLQKSK